MSVATTGDYLARIKKMSPEQRSKILSLAVPRIVEPYVAHIPHPKQQVFLSINAKEAMFGGAAGGGKSDTLLMAALQYVDVPGYSALILRRTWPDLNSPGAILDRARGWLSGTDVHMRDGGRIMEFPSGARIQFGYLQREDDKYKFQSAEYQFVGFDELTQFPEGAYTYLFSRIRKPDLVCLNCSTAVRPLPGSDAGEWEHSAPHSLCPEVQPDPKVLKQYGPAPDGTTIFDVPLRMRSASNPGGTGHDWVKSRFIDERTRVPDAIFVPSLLRDNPSLDQESYRENLEHLSPTDRDRLLSGDWDVTESGDVFERHWFNPVNEVPAEARRVRFWDRAATEDSGDWTVGILMAFHDGIWYIEDVIRGQWSSHKCEQIIQVVAKRDGIRIPVRMEQEPGSSGVDVIDHYRRNVLYGFNFDGVRATGSKATRASPLASAAEAGNLRIKVAAWNSKLIDEFVVFPEGNHDDQVDAASHGANFLAGNRRSKVLV